MKNMIKSLSIVLLIAGTAGAQNIVDEADITTIKEYEINDNQTLTVKTVSSQERVLSFDPKDAGKLNQSLVDAPVKVEETIWIDSDSDKRFDKEFKLSYLKDVDQELNYSPTMDGIYINTSDDTIVITEAGSFEVDADAVENVKIEVETLSDEK